MKKTLLVILDGFGMAPPGRPGNAITPETAPTIFELMRTYPSTTLTAHGRAVGLPKGQEGNSEAGHLNIGAGRVIEQDICAVSSAIHDGRFFKNPALKEACTKVKEQRTRLHLVGLLTGEKSAHASPEHLYALLELAKREGIHNSVLHLFTDGRDSSPHAAMGFLSELKKHLGPSDVIASMMGRFYAMDRNKSWDRTKKAYDLLTGTDLPHCAESAEAAIESGYNRGETDEYLQPTCINGGPHIQSGDAVIFFNARSDRARQLAKAFVQKDFETRNADTLERRIILKDLFFVAMSEFGPDLDHIVTAFPSSDIDDCLAKAIGEHARQLYISETEKYAHVTYFINGGYPNSINGEQRELIRSRGAYSYAEYPEMQTTFIAEKIIQYFRTNQYDFICVNFPNADMVGHTGDFEATKKAIAVLDETIADLVRYMHEQQGLVIITADHGNAEEMTDLQTGEVETSHTKNPVPFILVDETLRWKSLREGGSLIDVAPTLLALLRIHQPKHMTGKSLL